MGLLIDTRAGCWELSLGVIVRKKVVGEAVFSIVDF